MALVAKEMNKPFYVLAESFKFVRLYPLNGRDLPKELKVSSFNINNCYQYDASSYFSLVPVEHFEDQPRPNEPTPASRLYASWLLDASVYGFGNSYTVSCQR